MHTTVAKAANKPHSSGKDLHEPRHPIQVVARRTGLSADVIRAWERRYAAVSPGRTKTGRRLYSDADIRRLALMRRASEGGRRIGDVASLSDQALTELVAADESLQFKTSVEARSAVSGSAAARHLNISLAAVDQLQPDMLESVLESARVALSAPVLLDEVIIPLIRYIGEGWHSGSMRVAQEHMATAVLLPFLSRLYTSSAMSSDGPTVVIATPVRQRHELGALMAAVTAANEGWKVIYLGTNLPAEEIAYAAACSNARIAALSIVYPTDDPQLPGELQRLCTGLPDGVALVVGGAAAINYSSILDKLDASQVNDLTQFREVLRHPLSPRHRA